MQCFIPTPYKVLLKRSREIGIKLEKKVTTFDDSHCPSPKWWPRESTDLKQTTIAAEAILFINMYFTIVEHHLLPRKVDTLTCDESLFITTDIISSSL